MSLEEKHKLGIGLQSLPLEKMEQVIQIIRKRNGNLKQDEDEIELDIEALLDNLNNNNAASNKFNGKLTPAVQVVILL
ncbi:hypothetical protein S83_013017 [Arachis hypogaea]